MSRKVSSASSLEDVASSSKSQEEEDSEGRSMSYCVVTLPLQSLNSCSTFIKLPQEAFTPLEREVQLLV